MSAVQGQPPFDAAGLLAGWPARCRPMLADDLDDVDALEHQIYSFPWTRGNFADSLRSGYDAWAVRDGAGRLVAYCVAMMAMDELHLLNISVAPWAQGLGIGYRLLQWTEEQALLHRAQSVLLEVRPSNVVAKTLYERTGYERIGLRKGYYPAVKGREDAIVMRKALAQRGLPSGGQDGQ